MHVIAHQTIGEYLDATLLRVPNHKPEIEVPICVMEEDVLLAIAPCTIHVRASQRVHNVVVVAYKLGLRPSEDIPN